MKKGFCRLMRQNPFFDMFSSALFLTDLLSEITGSAEQLDEVVTDLDIAGLKRTKSAVVLPVGDDARRCDFVAGSLDGRDIELDEGLALLDLITVFDEGLEVLALELNCIDTDVHQDLSAVCGRHCNCVLGVEYHGDLTISRSYQFTYCGLNSNTVSEHAACKCLILNFVHEEHLTCQAGTEDLILHLGSCRSGSCGSGLSGSLVFHCGQRDRTVAEFLNQLFEVGLNDRYGRSVDDLDTIALDNNAGSAGGLEQCLVNLGGIHECQTKSGSAAVDIACDVVQTADSLEDRSGLGINVSSCSFAACDADTGCLAVLFLGDHLDFRVACLTAGGLEILLEDESTEYEEVQDEVDREQRQQPDPVGLRVAGKDTVQDQVDETV